MAVGHDVLKFMRICRVTRSACGYVVETPPAGLAGNYFFLSDRVNVFLPILSCQTLLVNESLSMRSWENLGYRWGNLSGVRQTNPGHPKPSHTAV
jgi:hypothetical protein